MPWKETSVVDERMEFIKEVFKKSLPLSRLCREFAISRMTGYKWIERFRKKGEEGLRDLSRRPHHHPKEIESSTREMILAIKDAHPTWGPQKIRDHLENEGKKGLPVRSSFARVLRAAGLTVERPKRSKAPQTQPFRDTLAPNDTWCADYKGWFVVGSGQRCHPLTISDACSRYLIRCVGMESCNGEAAKPVFRAAFLECGLPRAIRTDNGSPFASRGIRGLSRLSVWWIKLGIVPERIEPGRPEQNGRHERMHRTLKEEATIPPGATIGAQQRRFDLFRREYNEVRPHEALYGATPGSVYQRSSREYPLREPEVEYEEGVVVRRVRSNGEAKWQGGRIFVGEALAGELVGFEELEERYWRVRFGPVELGWFDKRRGEIVAPAPRGGYF